MSYSLPNFRLNLALIVALLPAWLLAQTQPDAGSVQRDLQTQPQEAPRATPPLLTVPAQAPSDGDRTQTFKVSAIAISGNTAFSVEELLALVRQDLVGKQLTLADLQTAAARITRFYRERGYPVARAYLPEQKIDASGARIEFAMLEGVLGRVDVANRSRLSARVVELLLEPLRPGQAISNEMVDRPLLLLMDQAGVASVGTSVRPGEQVGGSDLRLEIEPTPVIDGQLELDNYGDRYTGKNRLTGQINLLSPLGLGERFSVRVTQALGKLDSVNLQASAPLGLWWGQPGLRVGLGASRLNYELGQDFANLQASGTSQSINAFASQALVRRQTWNLNTTLNLESKFLEDRVGATNTVTTKRSEGLSLGLSGDLRGLLGGNDVLAWSVDYLRGELTIGDASAQAIDASTAKTQGSFDKWQGALLYQKAMADGLLLHASARAQWAGKNLNSSEKMSLGGANGVRAYPQGEAAGDTAELLSLELRQSLQAWTGTWLGATPTGVLFADYGQVRINHTPYSTSVNNRSLGAVGLGFLLTRRDGFTLRAYLAQRTGNEAPSSETDSVWRFWMQIGYRF